MVGFLKSNNAQSGWTLFQWLFLIAAFLAATVTFVAVSDMDPIDPVSRDVQVLLIVNTVIIGILALIIAQRYMATRNDKRGEGGERLARRFLLLFGFSAAIPALVVSLFLWAAITRGFDTWFGERIVTLVEQTAAVAQENVQEFSDILEQDTRLMATDVNNALQGLTEDPERFSSYLGIQAYVRNMPAAYVIDDKGIPLAIGENAGGSGYFRRPTNEMFDEADQGEVILSLQEGEGFASSLVKLDGMEDAYLYLAKPLDRDAFARLRPAPGRAPGA